MTSYALDLVTRPDEVTLAVFYEGDTWVILEASLPMLTAR
jgi:hypothetical protein